MDPCEDPCVLNHDLAEVTDMNIAWLYLDTRNAAINALKDYEGMNYIIQTAPSEIAATQECMTGIGGLALSDMPKGPHNPHAAEDRIVKAMDSISLLNERYRRAEEYMAWFLPAWQTLSEQERFVLSRFYMDDESKQVDSVGEICERFHIERTSAYKKKDRALSRLTLLLYGK